MGNSVFKSLKDKLYGRQDVRILMCGLDAAGKTTILYKLKLGEVVTTIPTIGFNIESVEYKNIQLTSWDVGGRCNMTIQHGRINFTAWDVSGRSGIRPLWRHYYQNTDALIFVVDSNDRERIDECKHEIHRFLTEDELKDAMLLIMANKQDLPNAMSIAELTDKLNLHDIRERQWYIQASCATTGDGLRDGLDWLHSQLTGKAVKKSILKPVEETRDSVTKSQGTLASLYSSITSYFNNVNVSS